MPESDSPNRQPSAARRALGLGATGLLAIVAMAILLRMEGVPREAAFMAGIFVAAATLWVTELLPLFATSLLVLAAQILLLANPGGWPGLGFESAPSPSLGSLLAVAADPVLTLFFGGFVLAQAVVKEGLDRALSARLLGPFGTRPHSVLLGLMLVTLLFSMWMSNTATTVMMMAMVSPMLASMPPGEPFRKAIVLGIPFSANIGGMGTPIASPPNAVAAGYLRNSGNPVTFLEWMLLAVPLVVALALVTWFLLGRAFAPATPGLRLNHEGGQLSRRGWIVVGVFIVTVLLWMTDQWHGLPSALVALLPPIVLTATGLFTRDDLGRLDWSVLILIAGGISLGTGLQLTGLDKLIVHALPTSSGNGLLLLTTLVLATLGIGTFMSNTAAANLLIPIGLSAATTAGSLGPTGTLSPARVVLSIALAASLSMGLPVSTPPNAIAYATGEITTRDMARMAALIGAVAAVLILVGGEFVMRWAARLN